MPSKQASSKEKVQVPFIMTEIHENLSWKVWSDNLVNSYSEVDMWVIGDLSGKIWAQTVKQQSPTEDGGSNPETTQLPIAPVQEAETQKVINGVKNQFLIRSTGITLGGEYFGFVQGNNINTATFRSDKGCVAVSLLRNNYIIALSFSTNSFPRNFYQQIRDASKSVKLLWY
ncbi:uncharacterized protein LOC142350979 [Convolutriloba macropyga]|uniref:uncharacterized protein LOC142350979 n=1 Tax=Convolutriloba macropyga TaxID=536237 RepID=UPI003F524414